jgi:hypothetical protein
MIGGVAMSNAKKRDPLKNLLGRLDKGERLIIDQIDERIRGKQLELSMLMSVKVSHFRDFLRRRKLIVNDVRGLDQEEFYLCAKDEMGIARDCCGWVKDKPIEENYEYKKSGRIIKGVIYRCVVCQKIVGEKVL